MRILLIEDDLRLASLVSRALTSDGHTVEVVSDGLDALERARGGGFDLLVLDRRLPRLDGIAILGALRAGGDRTAVLMLTAAASPVERVGGLNAGADDYLIKPFDVPELLARVRALGRRVEERSVVALGAGRLVLDEVRHVVRCDGLEADLSAREFALLALMVRRPGRPIAREDILAAVWGGDSEAYANVVDLYVSYLRRKLETIGAEGMIHTVRGVGYQLDPT